MVTRGLSLAVPAVDAVLPRFLCCNEIKNEFFFVKLYGSNILTEV
jgi:hypothetical protein